MHDFAEQIGKKLAAAELMGAEGDVEGSIKLMEEVSPSDWSYLLKKDSLKGGGGSKKKELEIRYILKAFIQKKD